MRHRSLEEFRPVDARGKFAEVDYSDLRFESGAISKLKGLVASATPATESGTLDLDELGDLLAYDLVAGQTYTFAYRPSAVDGIEDPLLALMNSHGHVLVQDDDGGHGRSSLITFTPTKSGTYYLYATSWVTQFTNEVDAGGYDLHMWVKGEAPDVGGTRATSEVVDMSVDGTIYSNLETAGDVDLYKVTLEAGRYYEWVYNGGVDGSTVGSEESVPSLTLHDADGVLIAQPVILAETGLGFVAQESGTYYVRVSGADPSFVSGYTLDYRSLDLSGYDPLEAIKWDEAENIPTTLVDGVPTAYVYFAPAGENFGETNDQGGPMHTLGWSQHEIDAVMSAFAEYTRILGIEYVITTDPEQATFRLMTTTSDDYGAYAYPQAPDYGEQAGIVVFNVDSGGWAQLPQSLDVGGYSYAVILHELGHAHGLSHPHDTGGGSEILLGTFSSTDSFGVYNLNQGVYTVMSYNDAWIFHPDGESSFTINGIDNGWSATLSAFDIAALQQRYGVQTERETGDNVYALTDQVNDAYYQTIWDTGGTDAITYGGSLNAQIDLTAATLDYSATGGGVLSFLFNDPATTPASAEIKGGYTIANGVVIENASGGSGHDALLGNSAANVLSGNGGNDTLMGRGGDDTLDGGAGNDTATYAESTAGVTVDLNAGTASGDGADTLISVENVIGSNHADTISGDEADNTIEGLDGADTLAGGDGNDTLSYQRARGGVSVNLATLMVAGAAGADIISGFENLIGSAFADTLTGDAGNNIIEGRAGNDTLDGGLGVDTASYSSSAAGVTVNIDAGTATGAGTDTLSGFENVLGSAFADTITGSSGDNRLDGGAGIDTVSYANATGAVTVSLAAGTATGFGSDTLVSIESVTGSAHADVITGSSAANRISAGAGDDRVSGGNGVDVITLGAGNDRIKAEAFSTNKVALKSGSMSVDIVTDFDAAGMGNDLIDLSGLGITASNFDFRGTNSVKGTGDVGYKSYGSVSAAEEALGFDIDGQSGATVTGPVTVVYMDGNGGGADAAIILLNTSSVDAGDFIFG